MNTVFEVCNPQMRPLILGILVVRLYWKLLKIKLPVWPSKHSLEQIILVQRIIEQLTD